MAEETDVKETPQEKKVQLFFRDFDGQVILEFRVSAPLPFPYVFHEGRLFVASKDDENTYLERSYCVYTNMPLPEKLIDKVRQFPGPKTQQ
jgi:hypothetical protein